jgi:hypothetical protein
LLPPEYDLPGPAKRIRPGLKSAEVDQSPM